MSLIFIGCCLATSLKQWDAKEALTSLKQQKTDEITHALTHDRRAIMTVVIGDAYTAGAIALGRSIKATNPKEEAIVLVDELSAKSRHQLADAGWKLRNISTTAINDPNGTETRWRTFSKLKVWMQEDLHYAVVIDSDTLVVKPLHKLLKQVRRICCGKEGLKEGQQSEADACMKRPRAPNELLAVPISDWGGADKSKFNSGIMGICPSMSAFNAMTAILKEHSFTSSATPGEQDLLIHWASRNSDSGSSPFELAQDYNWRVLKKPYRNISAARERAHIIHFLGYPKPWELMDLDTGTPRKVVDSLALAKKFGPKHQADY